LLGSYAIDEHFQYFNNTTLDNEDLALHL